MGHFNGEKSLNLRVWHWLNFVAILGLMFTYIFRITWFNKNDNALIIQNKLLEFGIELSHDNSMVLAKTLRAAMWDWHYIFGFLFIFLIIFRAFAFIGKREKCPLEKIKAASTFEEKGVKIMHFIFYIVSFYMVISGLLMFFKDDLGIAKESLKLVKTLHEYSFWFFLLFIFAHIFGVVKAEIKSDKGLISEMFNGGKK